MSENDWQQWWWQLSLATVAVLNAAVALAQDAETEEAPPRFAVEILVFENLDQSRNTPEVPPPPPLYADADQQPEKPVAEPRTSRRDSDSTIEFLLLEPHPGLPDFLAVPPDRFELNQARERLERLDAYRPILHAGWTQQARRRGAARAAILGVDTVPSRELTGSIRLYKERYLHLVVDLELAAPESLPAATGDGIMLSSANAAPPPAQIRESRRLRGELTQYFDHPRFGLLARVRQLDEPAAEEPGVEPGSN